MQDIDDFLLYSRKFFKINTKLHGTLPFEVRDYQRECIDFIENIKGPKRCIILKPRQAGLSTLISGFFTHKMMTMELFKGILMADESSRTDEVMKIYLTFIKQMLTNKNAAQFVPMIKYMSSEQIVFENPKRITDKELEGLTLPQQDALLGLRSELQCETANDKNAGRAGSRRFAHLSEAAFYPYAEDIDEGIQNSIPTADGTYIIQESTANGRGGTGKAFYDLYMAAKAGDSLYKSYFIPWYRIDDYAIDPGRNFTLTAYERDVMKQHGVTEANLAWRRLKLSEYRKGDEEALMTPEDRFCQDFPLDDQEAFISSGQPVFPPQETNRIINSLSKNRPAQINVDNLEPSVWVKRFQKGLELYTPPRKGKEYYIGADVSEGLAIGDASSCFIMDGEFNQVGRWHGKIDPSDFGHLLIALGDIYNTALIAPECNNMGHTVVTVIKESGYPRLYKKVTEDKVKKTKSTTYGYRTTEQSKNDMLNELIKLVKDRELRILDVKLPIQMNDVTRGENGRVNLNGKDRVVAAAIAVIARRQFKPRGVRSERYKARLKG